MNGVGSILLALAGGFLIGYGVVLILCGIAKVISWALHVRHLYWERRFNAKVRASGLNEATQDFLINATLEELQMYQRAGKNMIQ